MAAIVISRQGTPLEGDDRGTDAEEDDNNDNDDDDDRDQHHSSRGMKSIVSPSESSSPHPE